MPRRKQTSRGSDNGTPKKQCYENSPLIISDSDENEVYLSELISPPCKHIVDMSEEEMLNLAMRLSTEEANSAAQRQQQEEEDAMRKAIAEMILFYLSICRVTSFRCRELLKAIQQIQTPRSIRTCSWAADHLRTSGAHYAAGPSTPDGRSRRRALRPLMILLNFHLALG
uniref:RAP80 N-terminal domain-containing protein n=1 Tax=Denticeps clupeoides TaxID=299321 RepID=A0AAY4AH79_9TELE